MASHWCQECCIQVVKATSNQWIFGSRSQKGFNALEYGSCCCRDEEIASLKTRSRANNLAATSDEAIRVALNSHVRLDFYDDRAFRFFYLCALVALGFAS